MQPAVIAWIILGAVVALCVLIAVLKEIPALRRELKILSM